MSNIEKIIEEYLVEMEIENERLLSDFSFFWLPPFQEKYMKKKMLTSIEFDEIINHSNEIIEKIKGYVSIEDFLAFDTRFGGKYKEYSLGILFKNENDKITAILACG